MRSRRFWWIQDSVRSTGQRVSPSPLLVVDPLLGQDRLDAHLPQPLAVRLGVVGQVPLQGVGLLPRVADLARHRRDAR